MIFICFSHVERYIVAQSLAYHLKNYGYQVWYDYDELFLGDNGDYLNFDEGLYKAKYVVIIVSKALFTSPCAISELEQIYTLYMRKEIIVIPVLYNISINEVPKTFLWINDIIYTEISNETGTFDVATQIAAKYLEDTIQVANYARLNSITVKSGKYSNYINCLISYYQKIDNNNINSRVTALYNIYLFLNYFYDLSNTPRYCTRSIDYLYENTNLNIPVNFKELSIMENSIVLLLNFIRLL